MATVDFTACCWRLLPCGDFDRVEIQEVAQRDGSVKYAVRQLGRVFDRDGVAELEPIPSSRTDEFLARFRFSDWEQAAIVAKRVAADTLRQREASRGH